VHLDFIMPLPKTKRGHTAAMCMVDKLGKMVHFAPTHTEVTGRGAAELFFRHWVQYYGLPTVIISDRDPRFMGHFWQALWSLCGTELHMTTPYC